VKTKTETKTTTTYTCEICDTEYCTEKEALDCEKQTITQNKGVKIGDEVMITYGDDTGYKATVTKISICDKYEGHYAWERYWHTPILTADVNGGTRLLHWDWYEVVK